jgi:hypothetical protein
MAGQQIVVTEEIEQSLVALEARSDSTGSILLETEAVQLPYRWGEDLIPIQSIASPLAPVAGGARQPGSFPLRTPINLPVQSRLRATARNDGDVAGSEIVFFAARAAGSTGGECQQPISENSRPFDLTIADSGVAGVAQQYRVRSPGTPIMITGAATTFAPDAALVHIYEQTPRTFWSRDPLRVGHFAASLVTDEKTRRWPRAFILPANETLIVSVRPVASGAFKFVFLGQTL